MVVEFVEISVVMGETVVVEFVEISVVVGEAVVVEFVDVPVVVEEAVVVVVVVDVVDSWQSTYSGQLQTFILESKKRPAGQDIRTGVRPLHS